MQMAAPEIYSSTFASRQYQHGPDPSKSTLHNNGNKIGRGNVKFECLHGDFDRHWVNGKLKII